MGELAVELGRGGDDQAADLLPGLGARLDRAAPGDLQHPDRLDDPVAALRRRSCFARQDQPSWRLRVDGVRLAEVTAAAAARPGDLDHLDALPGQETRKASTEAAGALDAGHRNGSAVARPSKEQPITASGRREAASA